MDMNFTQDDWTKTFCLIFNDLVEKGKVIKKLLLVKQLERGPQSTLNHIMNGTRIYPISKRQHAMKVLREVYKINLEYFKSHNNPIVFRNYRDR